jgi:hypothetical protein
VYKDRRSPFSDTPHITQDERAGRPGRHRGGIYRGEGNRKCPDLGRPHRRYSGPVSPLRYDPVPGVQVGTERMSVDKNEPGMSAGRL